MTIPDFLAPDEGALQQEANELVDLGLERYGSNRTEQALACWQRALEIDPTNVRALDYLRSAGWTEHRRVSSSGAVHELCRDVDQLVAAGDDEAALDLIEASPFEPVNHGVLAMRTEQLQERLLHHYASILGPLDGRVRYDTRALPALVSDDERIIAARATGKASMSELIHASGLAVFNASRALARMLSRGAITLVTDASPTTSVTPKKGNVLPNVKESLRDAMSLDGAIAVALVDYDSGMTLGTEGDAHLFNIDVAAAGNTQVVRAKLDVMRQLNIGGGIEDILITLDGQYHLIRLLQGTSLFLYVALDRARGNLGMARHRLKAIQGALVI
jgi:hypothetical protein